MTDPEPPSLGQRRREAEERVRRQNLADRGADNVVPLRRTNPARPRPGIPRWARHPAAIWAAIVALLIVWYLLRGLF